MITCDW